MCVSVFSPFLLPDSFCDRPAVNQELSNLFNELWNLDADRMTPGVDYTISVQVWHLLICIYTYFVFCTKIYCVSDLSRVELAM